MQYIIENDEQARVSAQEYLQRLSISLVDEYSIFNNVHQNPSNEKFVTQYEKSEALSLLKQHSYIRSKVWHIVSSDGESHAVDIASSGDIIRFMQMSKESGYALQQGELCIDESFVQKSYDKQLALAAAQLFLQKTWNVIAQHPTSIKFEGHRWHFEYDDPSIPALQHSRAYLEIQVAAGQVVYATKELSINWAYEEYAKKQRANRRGLFVLAAMVVVTVVMILIGMYSKTE